MLKKILSQLESGGFFPFLLLGLISIVLFANTIGEQFVYDDKLVILYAPNIKHLHFFDLWNIMGRSVRTLSLSIDYQAFGNNPKFYHLQNIFWHMSSVLLLYLTYYRISKDRIISFLGSVIFTVHPIHVEAVANISNRKELLTMFFSLLSFLSYIKFLELETKKKWLWLSFSILWWYVALNSKQVAIVLPLSAVMYEIIFVPYEKRFITKNPVIFLTILTLGAFSLSIYLSRILDFSDLSRIDTLKGYRGELSFFSVSITSARAFFNYIQLLLFPINLSPEYNIELSSSLADPKFIFSWLFILGYFYLIIRTMRSSPVFSFGLSWLIIHYIPVSNLIPSAYIVADRYMYLPSAGYSLLLAFLMRFICVDLRMHKSFRSDFRILSLLSFLLVTAFSVVTVQYNAIWQSNKSLWQHTIKVMPNSFKAYNNLAVAYKKEGNLNMALDIYNKLIKTADRPEPYLNRGIIYYDKGLYQLALNDFNKAIEIDPHSENAYNNRGNLYQKLGKKMLAMQDYNKALKYNDKDYKIYFNRGNIYSSMGQHKEAISDLTMSIKLDPGYAEAYFNRGISNGLINEYSKAIIDFSTAIELKPDYIEAFNSRGIMYFKTGDIKSAIRDYERVININPEYATAYYNIGLAYSKMGNSAMSEKYYNLAEELGLGNSDKLRH